jgi:hypothetical protein
MMLYEKCQIMGPEAIRSASEKCIWKSRTMSEAVMDAVQ